MHPVQVGKAASFALLLSVSLWTSPLAAQAPSDRIRVYLDCGFCDMDFVRTEIDWVDYMRDRADAQVHVLVSRETTGGGGFEFSLEFIGLREFAPRADTLVYVSGANDSQDIRRRGLTRSFGLGLVPFVAGTAVGSELEVRRAPPLVAPGAGAPPPASVQEDPWNFWTFSVGLNGSAFGETQQSSGSISTNLTANRTTEAWKINSRLSGSYAESKFKYESGGEQIRTLSIRRSYNANTLVVKSLGPHLSVGGRTVASMSTFGNTAFSLSVMPAIEYNFVPYAESTRRSMIVRYGLGGQYADYRETTIFGQDEETLPMHDLVVGYATRQPWGSASVSLSGSQYLHDLEKYNAGISVSTNLQLLRGFSLNVSGGYTRVRDQLSLPARNLTEEEILLRQRQLATGHSYMLFLGLNYRFGSIFNNVVNPRFTTSGGGGHMMIMM